MSQTTNQPDFIGIGMSKCGTTWLYNLLHSHTQVSMPAVKEVHFFNEYFEGDAKRYFSDDSYARARWQRNAKSLIKRALRFPSIKNLQWTWHFLLARRSIQWYSKTITTVPKKSTITNTNRNGNGNGNNHNDNKNRFVAGEITPAYGILNAENISRIKHYYPELKVILLLRNPIERLWSHAKMELVMRPKRNIVDVSTAEFEDFLFDQEAVSARSRYKKIIQQWQAVFGDNLFIGLYDDISNQPKDLINELCEFLSIDHDYDETLLNKVVFKGSAEKIPETLRKKLYDAYETDIKFVANHLQRPEINKDWC